MYEPLGGDGYRSPGRDAQTDPVGNAGTKRFNRRLHFAAVIAALAILGVIIGALSFVLVARSPHIHLTGLSASSLSFHHHHHRGVSVAINATLSVDNPNYYPLHFQNLTLWCQIRQNRSSERIQQDDHQHHLTNKAAPLLLLLSEDHHHYDDGSADDDDDDDDDELIVMAGFGGNEHQVQHTHSPLALDDEVTFSGIVSSPFQLSQQDYSTLISIRDYKCRMKMPTSMTWSGLATLVYSTIHTDVVIPPFTTNFTCPNP